MKVFVTHSQVDGNPIYRWGSVVWKEYPCGKRQVLADGLNPMFPVGYTIITPDRIIYNKEL